MQKRHSINFVGTDNTDICHSNFFGMALFDEGKHIDFVGIAWELLAYPCQPEVIDHIDEF